MLFAILLFAVGFAVYYFIFEYDSTAAAIANTADCVSYDEDSSVLTLLKRDSRVSRIVKIKKDHDISIKHEDETLHIGAVSVGGVVSGGAYTTGGYDYISDDGHNGLYKLTYGYCSTIKKIKLDAELFKQAQNSNIAQYLDDTDNSIRVEDEPVMSNFEREMAFNMLQAGHIDSVLKRGYPSHAKCVQILNWITTSDN